MRECKIYLIFLLIVYWSMCWIYEGAEDKYGDEGKMRLDIVQDIIN